MLVRATIVLAVVALFVACRPAAGTKCPPGAAREFSGLGDEPTQARSDRRLATGSDQAIDSQGPGADMQRVEVLGIVDDPSAGGQVVLLYHQPSERVVPIGIGEREAQTIALRLSGQRFPRPLTHDLLDTLVQRMGATIVRVEIDALEDSTFLANLIVRDADGQLHEVDARPSDCIALAAGSSVEVYVASAVLDAAGMPAKLDPGQPPPAKPPTTRRAPHQRNVRAIHAATSPASGSPASR